MKFAFLVHPISAETRKLAEFDPTGTLKSAWGQDLFAFCSHLHRTALKLQMGADLEVPAEVRVVDELTGLLSPRGVEAEGRLYEIPMDAAEILDDPASAMQHIETAVQQAAEWGAKIVGLGSMTGIVGGQGTYLAERAPVPVTTGNSLTVHAVLESLHHACKEARMDLARETVAVVGVPGSIATAVAAYLSRRCGSLVLVGRRRSSRTLQIAEQLGAELLLDIPQGLHRARIIVSATSSGNCIDQQLLRPNSIVVDAAVPTDVIGTAAERGDALILSGGLTRVPRTMSVESRYLWFHHGMVPACLAETMLLALEERGESYSLGRNLKQEHIAEIGELAHSHGFDFSRLFSFGLPLEESVLVRFRKSVARSTAACGNGKPRSGSTARTVDGGAGARDLAPRARSLYGRYVNPVLVGLGGESGIVRTFVRGEGVHLWDDQGNCLLDFVAGFGSLNLGHNHPAVVEALAQAMRDAAPGFAQSSVNPFAAALAEQLVTLAPPGLEMVCFANSGSEAVEAALKLARLSTGRAGLLHCERSFHGKTLGSLSVTGNPTYQRPFGPLLPECRAVVFGDLEGLERALSTRQFAAFVVEPIQGEGGMVVPPQDYLREAQRLCRKTGTLFVVDEIQTGLGRTGALFAVDHDQLEPDIMTLAKSLGGGIMPIGAALMRRDLWLKAYGTIHSFALHTSTFGGGSLACAAGLATLRVTEQEGLVQNATARGRQLYSKLNAMCGQYDVLSEVRGRGLMLGLEFNPAPPSVLAHWKEADGGTSAHLVPNFEQIIADSPTLYVMQTLMEEYGIYTQVTRSNPRVLRIQPPLVIDAEQVDRFLGALNMCCMVLDYTYKTVAGVSAKSRMGQHQGNRRPTAPKPASEVPL